MMITNSSPGHGVLLAFCCVIASMVAFSPPLRAQLPSLDDVGGGTRYMLAFPDTIGTQLDPEYPNTIINGQFTIHIYSLVEGNPVRIIRGDGGESTLLPRPGRFLTVTVTPDPAVVRVGVASRNIVTVESLYPVVVYCTVLTAQGMDAWTPLPVDRWGKSYTVAAMAGTYVSDIGANLNKGKVPPRKGAPGEILIIAAYDNTHVTVTAGHGERFADGAGVAQATLRAGECFQLQSFVDTTTDFDGDQVDIAGARVKADRPVGVISGNTRSLVWPNGEGALMNAYKNIGMEWLAPVEEHGHEFVFMPSWDTHRPGSGSLDERAGEVVRIYGTSAPSTGFSVLPEGMVSPRGPIAKDTLAQIDLPSARAARFRTTAPSQAYMHSASILRVTSQYPCGKSICEEYVGWAPYMVELVPREQWSSFAPYYTPAAPVGMLHYINVVTDTASARKVVNEYGEPFPFQWKIDGTDLIWGTMMMGGGESHYLRGRDGVRFGGFVYGFRGGETGYYPWLSTGASVKEYSALSYAYPLVALRNVPAPPDNYRLTSSSDDCGRIEVNIRATNGDPVGIRSMALDPAVSVNTRIIPIAPETLAEANGLAYADIMLAPIDPLADAQGRLVVRDRTGSTLSMAYAYQVPQLSIDADSLDLGDRPINAPVDTVITLTNPIDADVAITRVALAPPVAGFFIVGTLPEGPAATIPRPVTLRRGETLAVRLRLSAPIVGEYHALLTVTFGCAGVVREIPLHGSIVEPIITVGDLSFDTLGLGSPSKIMDLAICNVGQGYIRFGSPASDTVLEVRGEGFGVAPSELERLKRTTIGPGECFALRVSFTPSRVGTFTARARLFDNARRVRDTSVWRAVVVDSSILAVDAVTTGYTLEDPRPNPSGGRIAIGYAIGRSGRTVVSIHDNTGGTVATLVAGTMSAGEHRAEWDASGVAAGIYYCRITSGGWSAVRPIVVVR